LDNFQNVFKPIFDAVIADIAEETQNDGVKT
jgi:hypothetical protein